MVVWYGVAVVGGCIMLWSCGMAVVMLHHGCVVWWWSCSVVVVALHCSGVMWWWSRCDGYIIALLPSMVVVATLCSHHLVINMGNPWVSSSIPIPIPTKTPT